MTDGDAERKIVVLTAAPGGEDETRPRLAAVSGATAPARGRAGAATAGRLRSGRSGVHSGGRRSRDAGQRGGSLVQAAVVVVRPIDSCLPLMSA